MVNFSGPQLAIGLVLDVVMGLLGYHLAETDKRNLGRTPWGLPSIAWALIWFVWFPIGFVLWIIAHRAEVRRSTQTPIGPFGAGPATAPPAPSRSVGSDFPAYPRPAHGGAGTPAARPAPAAPPPPPPPPVPPATGGSPPAWHPDPSGRFQYRWWTGAEWTSFVATHGQVQVDASPDQRIGPY